MDENETVPVTPEEELAEALEGEDEEVVTPTDELGGGEEVEPSTPTASQSAE